MTEKDFSSEITHSLRADGLWTYKIPDIGKVYKPFDRIVECGGMMFGIEEKQTKTKRFYFRNIRPHQIAELLQLRYGYFLINYRYDKVNKAVLVPAKIIKSLMDAGKEYIEYEDGIMFIGGYGISYKNKVWNIGSILCYIVSYHHAEV